MIKSIICFLILFPAMVSAGLVVLSRQLTSEIMDNAKVSQKNTSNGAIIVITAKDPRIVEKVKKIVMENIRLPHFSKTGPDQTVELLRIKQIDKSFILLNNGIKLGLTSDRPEWIAKIHQLKKFGLKKMARDQGK